MDTTALLVMDVQGGIVDRLPDKDAYLERLKQTVTAAKEQGMAVFYVVVGFRPGFPEVSPHNKSFSTMEAAMKDRLVNPRPALELAEDDIVIYKRRVSAFAGSDLEVLLSGQGIKHLVLTGIATSGVVLSTVRQAADKDYQLTVLADLCADTDPEVHRLLTEKIFPRQASVTTAEAWAAGLKQTPKEA